MPSATTATPGERLARGHRQQLQAGADGGHHQHAERHQVQPGQRPAQAAGEAGQRR